MILKPGQYFNYVFGHYDSSHYNYKGARKAAQIIGVKLKESGKLPAKLAKKITIDADYYKGITKDIKPVKIKKVKTGYKVSWKKKKAKRYKVYKYNPRKDKYKQVLVTKRIPVSL